MILKASFGSQWSTWSCQERKVIYPLHLGVLTFQGRGLAQPIVTLSYAPSMLDPLTFHHNHLAKIPVLVKPVVGRWTLVRDTQEQNGLSHITWMITAFKWSLSSACQVHYIPLIYSLFHWLGWLINLISSYCFLNSNISFSSLSAEDLASHLSMKMETIGWECFHKLSQPQQPARFHCTHTLGLSS